MRDDIYCGQCGKETGLWGKNEGLCLDCYSRYRAKRDEEQRHNKKMEEEAERASSEARESARRAAEQRERHQQELLEQNERHHQEILDATLPWFPCVHCGKKERKDRVVENCGNNYCADCGSKLKECASCKKTFVFNGYRILYTKEEGVMYSRKHIESGDLTDKKTGKITGSYYNEFWKHNLVLCDSCYNTSKRTESKKWETSEVLKIEYEKLKAAKEQADEQERLHQQQIQENARRLAQELEQRRLVEEDKKLVKSRFTPIISFFIAFFVFLNLWFQADLSLAVSAGIGVVACIAMYFIIRPIIYGHEKGLFFGTGLGTFAGLLPGLFIYWTLEWSFILSWTISFIVITLFCVCLEALGLLDGFLDLLDRLS